MRADIPTVPQSIVMQQCRCPALSVLDSAGLAGLFTPWKTSGDDIGAKRYRLALALTDGRDRMHWSFVWFGYLVTWAAIPHILLRNKPPASTLAWIWAVILFP
jgi:hypothetical protein